MLKSQMRSIEAEKDNLYSKLKSLQEENMELKGKLINLKNLQYSSSSSTVSNGFTSLPPMSSQGLAEKDYEIERLKRIIEDLIKSNEEKDKRCDELAKQVIRFKRIQEIVLSAQTNVNPHLSSQNGNSLNLKNKSKI